MTYTKISPLPLVVTVFGPATAMLHDAPGGREIRFYLTLKHVKFVSKRDGIHEIQLYPITFDIRYL